MVELSGNGLAELDRNTLELQIEALEESIHDLEMELHSDGWRELIVDADQQFSRVGLRDISEISRIMAIKNPLVKRGVDLYKLYVWGQGMSVRAADDEINDVIQAFMDDHKNIVELTGHQARMAKEGEMLTDGNLFLVPFVNALTGKVRLRSIPFREIEDVICNPDDAKEPWFYRRIRSAQTTSIISGSTTVTTETVYHPDWRYNPVTKLSYIGGNRIEWDQPVFHLKTGGYSDWKFGLSEVYAAIDWGTAYKSFLEDWASIVRAYRRFAFQLTAKGGKKGIAAAKSKLNSTYGRPGEETNPAPVTGSTFVAGEGVSLSSINHSNATVKAEDGRRLLLMVAAVFGVPETFFGDTSVGNLATAKSLDRPTELAMMDRQSFWKSVHAQLFEFVLRWAVKAPRGALRGLGRIERVIEYDQIVESVVWKDSVDDQVDIDFPPIVQQELKDRIEAIAKAAERLGKYDSAVPIIAKMLLVALGEDDVDDILKKIFPNGEVPETNELVPPQLVPPQPGDSADPQADEDAEEQAQIERMMVEAVRELREALVNAG